MRVGTGIELDSIMGNKLYFSRGESRLVGFSNLNGKENLA